MLGFNMDEVVKEWNGLDLVLSKNCNSEVVLRRREVSANFWKDIRLKEFIVSKI